MEAGGLRFWQPPYEARRCQRCDLVFKSAIAEPGELEEYYRVVDFTRWETPGLYPTEAAVLGLLRRLPAGSRVADFGCSTGRLLSRLTPRHQCFGVEVNARAAQRAAAKAITILSTDELLDPGAEPFDAILMMDVFEHLTDPTELLVAMAERLAPAGKLVVSTGDADVLAVAGDPANFWYFRNVEHVCMITKGYADFFAARTALALTHWRHVSHYDSRVRERLYQWSQDLAYQILKRDRYPRWRRIVARLPRVKRAGSWAERPLHNLSADHAVVVWERSPGTPALTRSTPRGTTIAP
jgi:SAM-dependent methyltransferase